MLPSGIELKDWARLAAFIDGEGCINVHRQLRFRGQRREHTAHRLSIRVVNTDIRLMAWLKKTFGGNVVRENSKNQGKRFSSFHWEASLPSIEEILTNCLDLLILKRQQAEIGLAFRATFRKKNYEKVEPGVMNFREECRGKLKYFNSGEGKLANRVENVA